LTRNSQRQDSALPVFALVRAGRAAHQAVKEAFAGEGLSVRAHFVLLCLREYGGLSQRELADWLGMDRSDLVKLLDELERSGQLRREPDPHDRRRHALTLTPEGADALRRGAEVLDRATDGFLSELDPDQRATLHDLVLRALGVSG
jgi:DNA-binding MarR family transcriptional regulator